MVRGIAAAILVLVLFGASRDCMEAQVATVINQVSRTGNHFRYPPSSFGDRICFSDDGAGVVVSNGAMDTMFTTLPPELMIRFEKSLFGSFVGLDRIWVTGADKASTGDVIFAESTNGGRTWNQLPLDRLDGRPQYPTSIVQGLFDLQYDGYVRVDDLYSSDGGETWKYIPIPDSLKPYQLYDLRYQGNGVWALRSSRLNAWYQTDIESKTWKKSDIPDDVVTMYGTVDGRRVGYRSDSGLHRLIYWDSVNGYRDTSLFMPDGSALDSVTIGSLRQVSGGGIVAVVSLGLSEHVLAVYGGAGFTVVLPETVGKEHKTVSLPQFGGLSIISGSMMVYVKFEPIYGPPPLPDDVPAIVDVRDGTIYETTLRSEDEFITRYIHNGNLFQDIAGKYLLRRSLISQTIYVNGRIDDPYGRTSIVEYADVVISRNGQVHLLDEWGDVLKLSEDGYTILNGSAVDGLRRRSNSKQRITLDPSESVSVGSDLLWDAHGMPSDSIGFVALCGGRRLTGIDSSGNLHSLTADSTSAWTIGSNGTMYSGYRRISVKHPDGQSGVLSIQSRGEACIGAISEVDDQRLVVGLRGYIALTANVSDTVLGGLLYSTDAGMSWNEPVSDVPELAHALVGSIAMRGSDSSLWATATFAEVEYTDSSSPAVARQGRFILLRSMDKGMTWQTIHEQQYNGAWHSSGGTIVFGSNNVVLWQTLDRVHYSDNNGQTFRLVEGLEGLTLRISSMALDPTTGRVLIATNNGLYELPGVGVSVDEPTEKSYPAFWASTYPNPTTGKLTVKVQNLKAASGPVKRLEIVDIFGRSVYNIQPELAQQGTISGQDVIEFEADLSEEPGGVYFLVCSTNNENTLWKVLINR